MRASGLHQTLKCPLCFCRVCTNLMTVKRYDEFLKVFCLLIIYWRPNLHPDTASEIWPDPFVWPHAVDEISIISNRFYFLCVRDSLVLLARLKKNKVAIHHLINQFTFQPVVVPWSTFSRQTLTRHIIQV